MAKPFKLQSVLNYRQILEEQAQQALALSLQQQGALQTAIDQCLQELAQLDEQLQQRQKEGLSIADIALYESRISHCRLRCVELTKQLEQLQRTIGRQREQLLQAARERQVLEKLKDRQDAEYRQDIERIERLQLDEISLRNKEILP